MVPRPYLFCLRQARPLDLPDAMHRHQEAHLARLTVPAIHGATPALPPAPLRAARVCVAKAFTEEQLVEDGKVVAAIPQGHCM